MLWTALVSFLGGQGVEWWYNGFERFPSWRKRKAEANSKKVTESGYVEVEADAVNGEKVEAEMAREKKIQGIRSIVAGIGFFMGIVGIWGDGA